MTSNKFKMVFSGTGIILLLYACMLDVGNSFIAIIGLVAMGIYNFVTALVAEIKYKKQMK